LGAKQILFVEDKAQQRDLFQTFIDEWNYEHTEEERCFVVHTRDDFPSAKEALTNYRFDCALFDLRLPDPDGGPREKSSGNELARIGLHENGIPVGIITGLRDDLSDELEESDTVRVFNKGDGDSYANAIAWFAGLWDMMEALAAARKHMQGLAADVFVRRMWPQWGTISAAAGNDGGKLVRIVTRQYVNLMGELLGLEQGGGWHPFECYISPSLEPIRAQTGDIFELAGSHWVVLTPQCDMATGKSENVLFAFCDPDCLSDWDSNVTKLREATAEQFAKRSSYFRNLVNQKEPACHFLPALPGENRPLMVQFTKLMTQPLVDVTANLVNRKASVSAPFLSNLTQRFGAYISRTGQPNIDVKHFTDVSSE